jgi:hypothetical protein
LELMMERQILNNVSLLPNIVGELPIANGGTDTAIDSEIAGNLGLLLTSELGQASKAAQLTGANLANGKVAGKHTITKTRVDSPKNITINETVTFKITNHHNHRTYTISCLNGVISRSGDTITYTAPAVAGIDTITINGDDRTIDVNDYKIVKPSITSPVNAATNTNLTTSITSSAFAITGGTTTHVSTDWEMSNSSTFDTVFKVSKDDVVNLTSWNMSGVLENTTYFVRVRYKGDSENYGWSEWSDPVQFTTKASFLPTLLESTIPYSILSELNTSMSNMACDETMTRIVVTTQSNGNFLVLKKTNGVWAKEFYKVEAGSEQPWSLWMDATGTRLSVGRRVYVRSGTTWTLEFTAPYGGGKLAMDRYCDRIAIPYLSTERGYNNESMLRIYKRTGTTWALEFIYFFAAYLFLTNSFSNQSVVLNETGDRLFIGDIYATVSGVGNNGSVICFTRSGTTWTRQADIVPVTKLANGSFGTAIALDSDADTMVVTREGGARASIFTRTGEVWTETLDLTDPSIVEFARFGRGMHLSPDGMTLFVGDRMAPSVATYYGRVIIFKRNPSGLWEKKFVINETVQSNAVQYAVSIAINRDVNTLAVLRTASPIIDIYV